MDKDSQFSKKNDTKNEQHYAYKRWVVGIVVGDAIASIILLIIASQTTDWNTWASIMAVGLVGMASVDGVILQVLVAGRMTVIMDRQEFEITETRKVARDQHQAMLDALEETRKVVNQNERAIEASQRQALVAEKNLQQAIRHFELTERPALGFEDIAPRQNLDGTVIVVGIIINSGKVAAKIIKQEMSYGTIDPSDDIKAGIVPEPPTPIPLVGTPSIHINGRRELSFCKTEGSFWSANPPDDQPILFVWAKLVYVGLTSPTEYILEHYSAYDTGLKRFIECPTHNQIT